MLFVLVGSAAGDSRQPASESAPYATDDSGSPTAFNPSLRRSTFAPGGQHGFVSQHLPAVQENVELVGKLEMQTPDAFKFAPGIPPTPDPNQPDVVAGQIADLAIYKNTAYLDSWSEPSCKRGGFFSVDISNPASPQQLAFVPALEDTYHGEGAHAITLNTGPFQGDVLAVNNEPCGANGVGGFDLYDVTNPANPQILVQGAGDMSPDAPADPTVDCGPPLPDPLPEECAFADTTQDPDPDAVPNSAHSIFIWQDGSGANARAFAVIVDNTEIHDVDIFEITDPRNPQFITDVDLVSLSIARGQDIIDNSANGDAIFHHDMIVKEIGGVQTMLVSYWDSGYIKLDVEDPSNPQIIGDSAFDQEDPLVTDPTTGQGFERPEGNGHQAEFSHDNRFVLAADEDFSTYRLPLFEITTGPNAGPYPAGEFGFTKPMASLDDNVLNGPTVFGGYGCTADNEIPDAPGGLTLGPGEEAVVVLQRGPQSDTDDPSAPYPACTFQEKAENAAAKGWDAVIIGNHHTGAAGGADPDSALCGSGTGADIIGVCLGHRAMHLLFDQTPGYETPYPPGHMPAIGTQGHSIETESLFDGWGYTHLYRNTTTDLETVDHFAIEESIDERYATGFGDLSVHEFATDPTEYLAYSSYYAGGLRVFRFGDAGMDLTGKFIDQGGNNFWGVESFTTSQGDRLIAASDRDFGLYLFRYTGPGAAQKPVCTDTTVLVPFGGSADVPLPCSDANGNPLQQTRTSDPAGGTIADRAGGGWTYTHTGHGIGPAGSFTFKANDGAADSNTATASLVAVARDGGRCFNPFVGSSSANTIVGSPFGDRISGAGGNDAIGGRGGADCLSGNAGNDRVAGEGGADRVTGNAGNDRMFGGPGNDRMFGGAGGDRVNSGSGNDRVFVRNGGRDRVSCGSGRDRVRADSNDRVAGSCERVSRR